MMVFINSLMSRHLTKFWYLPRDIQYLINDSNAFHRVRVGLRQGLTRKEELVERKLGI